MIIACSGSVESQFDDGPSLMASCILRLFLYSAIQPGGVAYMGVYLDQFSQSKVPLMLLLLLLDIELILLRR